MKQRLPLLLLAIAIAFAGCVSKRYVKKGLKYEEAGFYELAAEMFYQAVLANPKNLDAAIGLRNNGQKVLSNKEFEVSKAYLNGDDKAVVYNYIESRAYFDKINATGVNIALSPATKGYFDEAKPRYLSKRYDEARLLLEDEKFKESEQIFAEIKQIDPGYQGVDEHMKVSQCEPLYRQGTEYLLNGLYRSAYLSFNTIIVNHGVYKDSKDLRDEALNKGMLTISMGAIKNNTNIADAATILQSKIVTQLGELRNPFIKVVEIKGNRIPVASASISEVSSTKMLMAKASFNGTVVKYTTFEGKEKREEKRGYMKEEVVNKDKVTGEEKKEVKYHKIVYLVVSKENNVNITFQYQLTSTETNAVLVSDAFDVNLSDQANYAIFEGDKSKLIPGYWEFADKDSPKDRIDESASADRALKQLLAANRNVKTVSTLQSEVTDRVAQRVAQKINQYNPENQ